MNLTCSCLALLKAAVSRGRMAPACIWLGQLPVCQAIPAHSWGVNLGQDPFPADSLIGKTFGGKECLIL